MERHPESEIPHTDRRTSIRMAAQAEGAETAYLRIGSKRVPVRILDRSAGGYLIEINGRTRASDDQPVELWAEGGRQPLRVVWQRHHDNRTDMGLQHIPYDPPWRTDASWVIWMLVAMVIGLGLGTWIALGPH